VVEAELQGLAQAEVRGVVEHADVRPAAGGLLGDGAGIVAAAVVDQHHFPAVLLLQAVHVRAERLEVRAEDGGLVVAG
jgi:hypothetical protein